MTNTTDNLAEFIAAETRENYRCARITWIIGLVVTLLVGIYMCGIKYYVGELILNPQVAAQVIRDQVQNAAIPALIGGLEDSLKQQATPLANALSRELMARMSLVRTEAENQIKLTHHQFLPLMREEIRSVIHAYVTENEVVLKELYADQKVEGFAKLYIEQLTAEITSDIERMIGETTNLNGIAGAESKALTYLQNVEGGLDTILSKPDAELSRSEKLQRRLIVAWVRIVEEKLAEKGL